MLDVVAVFAIGGLVGLGELIARYKDEPWRALRTPSAIVYCAINGAASLFALFALQTFGWSPQGTPEQARLLQVLVAGFGAMALFRTALFQVRVSGTDIGIGPIAFLQVFLAATDRGVDRKRAEDRARKVQLIMVDLTFPQVYSSLPAFGLALMQNLPAEDRAAIANQVKELATSQMPDEAKVLSLGLLLMNYLGEDVLEEAVLSLRERLGLRPPPDKRRRGASPRTQLNAMVPDDEVVVGSFMGPEPAVAIAISAGEEVLATAEAPRIRTRAAARK